MGTFGFSYVGLVYLLMLFIPNIIWSKKQPDGYREIEENENKFLVWFERIGQVLVTFCALSFADLNINKISLWSLWLLASFVSMLVYEGAWIRYFKHGNTLKNMYRKLIGIPVPLAVLPVLAFLLLGIYGKVLWLIISSVIFGIGHIGLHLQHLKAIRQ